MLKINNNVEIKRGLFAGDSGTIINTFKHKSDDIYLICVEKAYKGELSKFFATNKEDELELI